MRNLLSAQTRSISRRARAGRARRVSLEFLEGRQLLTAVGVPDGLVSWWTADNTAADLKGAHNGTLSGGTTYAQGEVGQAFNFDGINDTVLLPGTFGGGAEATIEAWIKTTGSSGDLQAIVEATDSNFVHLQLGTYGNNVAYTDGGVVGLPMLPESPVNVYQHVAFSIKSGDSRLYVNGSLMGTSTLTFSTILPTSNLRIGSGYQGGRFFKGGIDEVSYYNRALTANEIQGIYSAGSEGKIKSTNYFAADYPSVTEGPAATTTTANFTIRRVGSLAGQAVVNWATADGTATAGADYVSTSGQVVFQDGESQKTVQVTVNGDNTPESHENFWLTLSTTTPGYAAGGGLATIVDDDAGVYVDDAQANEGDPRFGGLGAFVSQADNGGLDRSSGMTYGPDGNLYVGSLNTNEVLRYSGTTGAFLGAFVTAGSGGLNGPAVDGLIFRDGLLYVASRNTNAVLRYNATTGAFVDTFVTTGSGGLLDPKGMVFAADGSLLVSSGTNEVLRYSGITGTFLGAFVSAGSGGLSNPRSLTYGPDGNLYVSSSASNAVLKYNGTTGAFISTFIPANSGGLSNPGDLLFSNGRLYVASQGTGEVLRYDAATGTFLDDAVPANSGGLDRPIGLLLDPAQNLLVGGYADLLRFAPPYPASFTVRLNHAASTTVTVDYSTSGISAQAGTDFINAAGTVTFAPGETSKVIRIMIVNDAVAEGTETFAVNLSNPVGGSIVDGQGIGTIHDDDATKFYVPNDATSGDRTYEYGALGASVENYAVNSGNTAPRGAASTAAGTTVWVVDANKSVYIYNNGGALLGSWTAGTLASNATVEGIATNGTDVWIVDAKQDKVFRYTGAATRTSGSQNAAGSFSLNSGNTNPKDIVTDGTSLWVVNDSTTDKVFKYSLTGSLLGSWTITGAGTSPTGITLDPTGGGTLWTVDSGTDRVYQFDNARGLTSGSLSPSTSFALAAGNTNPQGIADPPLPTSGALQTVAVNKASQPSGHLAAHHQRTVRKPIKASHHLPYVSSSILGPEMTPVRIPMMPSTAPDLTAVTAERPHTVTKRARIALRV